MANSAQARKRARQAAETNKHNASLHSTLRTAVKQVRKAIAGRRQGGGDAKAQVVASGDRSHRGQEDRPQESRVPDEVAARARDQGHGLTRFARSGQGRPRGALFHCCRRQLLHTRRGVAAWARRSLLDARLSRNAMSAESRRHAIAWLPRAVAGGVASSACRERRRGRQLRKHLSCRHDLRPPTRRPVARLASSRRRTTGAAAVRHGAPGRAHGGWIDAARFFGRAAAVACFALGAAFAAVPAADAADGDGLRRRRGKSKR